MITYYAKRSVGEQFEEVSSRIKDNVWVNGANLIESDLEEIAAQHQLDFSVIRDVLDRDELPRLEFSGDVAYIFLRSPMLARSGKIHSVPLLSVVKKTQFFTLSTKDSIAPESIVRLTRQSLQYNSSALLLDVIAYSVTEFESLIKHTSRSITDTANRLKTHDVTNRDFIHFVTVEENLYKCKMNLESTLAVVLRLKEDTRKLVSKTDIDSLEDVRLHIQQLIVAVNSHTQSITSIRNAYSTIANNKLNQRMKTLTILTVMITLPNVVYGMYGMNIALPFAQAPWAYGAISVFVVALMLVVFLVANRAGYFR